MMWKQLRRTYQRGILDEPRIKAFTKLTARLYDLSPEEADAKVRAAILQFAYE